MSENVPQTSTAFPKTTKGELDFFFKLFKFVQS